MEIRGEKLMCGKQSSLSRRGLDPHSLRQRRAFMWEASAGRIRAKVLHCTVRVCEDSPLTFSHLEVTCKRSCSASGRWNRHHSRCFSDGGQAPTSPYDWIDFLFPHFLVKSTWRYLNSGQKMKNSFQDSHHIQEQVPYAIFQTRVPRCFTGL